MNGQVISSWVADLGLWPLIIALLPNLMFRRFGSQEGIKRMASLIHAIAVFILFISASLVMIKNLTDMYFLGGVAISLLFLIVLRKKAFPYRKTCVECEKALTFQTIYFMDDNLCSSCRSSKSSAEDLDSDSGS